MPMQTNAPSEFWPDFDTFAEAASETLGGSFRRATPYPHLVIDDLFPPEMLRAMVTDFDGFLGWREFHGNLQRKHGTPPSVRLPPAVQNYFNLLYSGPFLRFLSKITGINDLIPDPALYGGGMHEVIAGGSFEIHLDFEKHPRTLLTNRLAVITYLNENWAPEDGGALELWDVAPPRCGMVVQPVFGKTVILEQSRRSAHGHPQPVREGRRRRAAVAYFYTNGISTKSMNDVLATTYIPHAGYTRFQRAELYLRRFIPKIVIKVLKTVFNLVAIRRR
jgi:2OG-Fe(II) oxygenase superfamily